MPLFEPWPRLVPFRAATCWHEPLDHLPPLDSIVFFLCLFSEGHVLTSNCSLLRYFGCCCGFIWTLASVNHESGSLICPARLAWAWHKEKLYFFYSQSFWTLPTLPIYFSPSKINTIKAPTMIKGTLLTHVLYQTNLFSICMHILKWFQYFIKAGSPIWRGKTYSAFAPTTYIVHSRIITLYGTNPPQFRVIINSTNHFHTLYEWSQNAEGNFKCQYRTNVEKQGSFFPPSKDSTE